MNCSNCNDNIIIPNSVNDSSDNTKIVTCSRNFAVKQGDSYICNACYEATLLFCDFDEKEDTKKEIIVKKKEVIESKFLCVKCQSSYDGRVCNKCNTPNPLFSRSSKKKKKRKNKK